MTVAVTVQDPYLALPLDGVRLIEASAGTGKTFTLATLVTRLVVERECRIAEILAVTFTEAATQELRKRIRERLVLAARLVGTTAAAGEPPEVTLTRQVIERRLAMAPESPARLRQRLQTAADEIDLAAIFTIHGFCARVLREHALESGQAFDAPTLLGSERELHAELGADLWRAFGADAATAEPLLTLWSAPEALAADLGALLRHRHLQPAAPAPTPDPLPDLQAAAACLRQAFAAHGATLRADLEAAIGGKVLNGGTYKLPMVAALFQDLHAWCAQADPAAPLDKRLDRLTAAVLADKTNKNCHDRTPTSPLCDAVAGYLAALAQRRAWADGRAIGLLHEVRQAAIARLQTLKQTRRVQTYDDLIDGVADALDGPHGDLLARRLREQYRIALVDEFQDTDDRQWAIFRRVFGDARAGDASAGDSRTGETHASDTHADGGALFLIGDPKQAIYGFRGGDVHTYLRAADGAERAPALARNFRSRPGLLRAIETLYAEAGDAAFLEDGIRFQPVQPGTKRSDEDFLRDGVPAPALTVRVLPPAADGKPLHAGSSRQQAADACVAAIHAVLADARAGRASLDGAPVAPGDIAVLVRTHGEATRIQRALAAAGIPAVAAGKQSLFATEEARELRAVFTALLQPGDEGRLRAALATVLVGVDAAGIAALESDGDRRRGHQLAALAWRERWQRSGPFALVSDLCAAHAERLLGLLDGERRLTNYLQLGELLQQVDARALGLHGLVDWLGRHIAEADANDEQQLLRLESDARRVQIVTLHKSKGLEYPLVFLPFVGIGGKPRAPGRHCVVHDGDKRVLHWKIDKEESRWDAAAKTAVREQAAEDARLLYVALTRAEHALWLVTGAFYNAAATRLAPMLAGLAALRAHPDVAVVDGPLPPRPAPLPAVAEPALPAARLSTRVVPRDWWVYSFTQLANADSGVEATAAAAIDERGADDERAVDDLATDLAASELTSIDRTAIDQAVIDQAVIDQAAAEPDAVAVGGADQSGSPAAARAGDSGNSGDGEGTTGSGEHDAAGTAPEAAALAADPRFAGSRFGNVLHEALENVDFTAWRDWRDGPAPAAQAAPLRAALRAGGYPDADLDDGIAALVPLVGRTLTVPLPEGGRLCELADGDRRAEIEFHFALQPTAVEALLRVLHAHGVVPERRGFGHRRRLEGLMTGKIDLTYTAGGRWYVLDYKSNRLGAYDPASLARAMAHSEYDLQALIYTLALHRWLRFRLGERYDYARDFGGVRYLFCRGLDASRADSPGVHAQVFAPALVEALDRLFAGAATAHDPHPAGAGRSAIPECAGDLA